MSEVSNTVAVTTGKMWTESVPAIYGTIQWSARSMEEVVGEFRGLNKKLTHRHY